MTLCCQSILGPPGALDFDTVSWIGFYFSVYYIAEKQCQNCL